MAIRAVYPWSLLACLLAAACDIQVGEKGLSFDIAEGRAEDEWVRSYTLPPGGELEIITANGGIDASRTAASQVEVRVERIARGTSQEAARALLAEIQMDEQVNESHVRIASRSERGNGSGFGRHTGITLRYHVLVPDSIAVSFRTGNGSIRLDGLKAGVTATTTNGVITGSGLSGSTKASAVNGSVLLDMASLTAD